MTLTPLPDDELAAVVTYLEMRQPSTSPPIPSALRLEHWPSPDLVRYRALFRRVGAPWLWFSRLAMTDAALTAIVGSPSVAVHAVADGEMDVGLLELDFRADGVAALAYVALEPALTERGHGPWLIGEALALAWRPGVERVVVHTCTLDHPAALSTYRKAGFAVVRRAVETFPDPRVRGWLDPGDAPQTALLADPPPKRR